MRLKVNISQLLIIVLLYYVFFPYKNSDINLYFVNISTVNLLAIILGIIVIVTDYKLKCRNIKGLIFMVIWFLYSALQLRFCESVGAHLSGMYYLLFAIYITGVFIMVMNNITVFKRIVRWMVFFIGVHNVWGWYECITHNYLYAPADKVQVMEETSFFKAITMFYNLNDYAMLMIAGVFLTFILYKTSESAFEKNLTLILMLSESASIIYSESRGALLGLLMGAATIGYLCMSKRVKRNLIIVVPLGLYAVFSVGLQFLESFGLLQDGALSGSDSVRINLIKNAFVFLRKRKIGIGLFNFEIWMQKYAKFPTDDIINLHNWWMEILVSGGIIIFVLYLRMYYVLTKDTFLKWKFAESQVVKGAALGILGYLASFVVSCISSSNNMNKMWIWVMFALLMAFQNIDIYNNQNQKDKGVTET